MEKFYREDKRDILFLTAITIYLFVVVLSETTLASNSFFVQAARYVRYLAYLLAVIKILLNFFDKKSFPVVCIIIALIAILALRMDSNTYLFHLLMIIAARDVNIRAIIRQIAIVQGTVLAIFVFAAQIGLVENYFFLQEGRNRYGLGFLYTTYAPTLFFVFMMCYIYLRKERMHIYEFAVLEGINWWLYFKTDSRLCFYLSTIMLVYVFFMRYYWQNRKERIRKNRWLILSPAGICVGSILAHAFYNPENAMWVTINRFFNSRLALGRSALDQYRITLFGQEITWIGNGKLHPVGQYNYVDCSYVKVLLDNGIITLILIVAAYTYLMYLAVKTKNYYLQTILLFTLVICITESRLLNWAFIPFLLLIAAAWRTKDAAELDKKEQIVFPRFKLRTVQIRFKSRI